MANYLLECEIVGVEVVHVQKKKTSSSTYKVRIIPNDIVGRSNLISPNNRFGVAIEEDGNRQFSAGLNASIKQIPLDDNCQTSLNVLDSEIFNALLACRGSRVVLELDDNNQVVGFKTAF